MSTPAFLPPGLTGLGVNQRRISSPPPTDRTHIRGTVGGVQRMNALLTAPSNLTAGLGGYDTTSGAIVITNRKPTFPVKLTYRRVDVTYPGPVFSYTPQTGPLPLSLPQNTNPGGGVAWHYFDNFSVTLLP